MADKEPRKKKTRKVAKKISTSSLAAKLHKEMETKASKEGKVVAKRGRAKKDALKAATATQEATTDTVYKLPDKPRTKRVRSNMMARPSGSAGPEDPKDVSERKEEESLEESLEDFIGNLDIEEIPLDDPLSPDVTLDTGDTLQGELDSLLEDMDIEELGTRDILKDVPPAPPAPPAKVDQKVVPPPPAMAGSPALDGADESNLPSVEDGTEADGSVPGTSLPEEPLIPSSEDGKVPGMPDVPDMSMGTDVPSHDEKVQDIPGTEDTSSPEASKDTEEERLAREAAEEEERRAREEEERKRLEEERILEDAKACADEVERRAPEGPPGPRTKDLSPEDMAALGNLTRLTEQIMGGMGGPGPVQEGIAFPEPGFGVSLSLEKALMGLAQASDDEMASISWQETVPTHHIDSFHSPVVDIFAEWEREDEPSSQDGGPDVNVNRASGGTEQGKKPGAAPVQERRPDATGMSGPPPSKETPSWNGPAKTTEPNTITKTAGESVEDRTTATEKAEDGRYQPLLNRIRPDYMSMTLLMRWIEFLLERCPRDKIAFLLEYYRSIGWISKNVEAVILAYARGEVQDVTAYEPPEDDADLIDAFSAEAEGIPHSYKKVSDWRLSAEDHLKSLLFIQKLNGLQVDKYSLGVMEHEVKTFKRSLKDYYEI